MKARMFNSVNPADGQLLKSYPSDTPSTVEAKLLAASEAFTKRFAFSMGERRAVIQALAAVTDSRKVDLAQLMALEMGKPVVQARAELEKCARLCRFMAGQAEEWLAIEALPSNTTTAYVRHDPLGIVLGIMPWNFPFWQVYRFIVPAILAGNVALLKHASNVTGCALAIADLMHEAGMPKGVFDVLCLSGDETRALISDDRIAAVTLTGSEAAGSEVAAAAGKAIKPVVLELGGSNAFIVLNDADIEKAADTFISARFQNTGQSCIAAKRLLVHASLSDAFAHALTGRMAELKMGDPLDSGTYIGPMARVDLAIDLERQMNESISKGARCETGGKRNGAWFTPALLTDVKPGMPAFDEETFGPLAAMTTFSTLDEAIALSNRSRFGLGVTVFTGQPEAIAEMADRFDEGAVFINDMVYSDPAFPFGGVKQSGIGRELGRDGMLAFVNRKTVVIAQR